MTLAERIAQSVDRAGGGGPVLLDGATGTELERRGARAALPLWSSHALLDDPALVERIHADYADAGAEVLTADTFRTQRRALARGGAGERDAELTALAVALARSAADAASRRVYVVGSAPTLEDCYRPDLVPDDDDLAREHAAHAANLAAAGVDGILVETMNTAREAAAAAAAARDTGLPLLVSFICDVAAKLLSGETLEQGVRAVIGARPDALLVNCLPPSHVGACLPVLRDSGLPFGVYANLGAPSYDPGAARTEDCTPDEFAEHAHAWIEAGASLVGGCCGTTPDHIRSLRERLSR